MAQCRLADQTLEEKDLVGKLHRVPVAKVDFHLPRAAFLGDTVDLEPLELGEIIDVVDDGAVFVHR